MTNNAKLSTIQTITKYLNEGYLFHGSTNNNIKKLEPRKATDTDSANDFNNDNAIFATEYPESAILFALINWDLIPEDIIDLSWGVNWLDDGIVQAELPIKWTDYINNAKGYLYVLPRETFKTKTPGGGQFKSYESVEPFEMLAVSFKDFLDLGGVVMWTE